MKGNLLISSGSSVSVALDESSGKHNVTGMKNVTKSEPNERLQSTSERIVIRVQTVDFPMNASK